MEIGKTASHGGKYLSFQGGERPWRVSCGLLKENMTLMSLSFAFYGGAVSGFYALLDFANRLLPVDGELNPDISIAPVENVNAIPKSMKDEMSRLSGVEAAFGSAMAFDLPALINGNEGSVDLVSYDDYMFRWTPECSCQRQYAVCSWRYKQCADNL